jgi:two-component system sensor histidine kinase/response regulator
MPHILVIEDDQVLNEKIKIMLELESYQVEQASTGSEGLDKARQLLPDLILCDIMLPEMDGFEILAALRSEADTQHLPLLFLTALADKRSMRQGMRLGADDYLIKPFEYDELMDAISARLQRQAQLRGAAEKRIDQLEQISLNKDKFLALICHDLNNSFSGVMGASMMLQHDLDRLKPEEIRTFASLMYDSTQSSVQMLQSMLNWSRQQIEGLAYEAAPIDLAALIAKVEYGLQPLLREKRQAISVDLAPHIHLHADAGMLESVMRNLLTNAIKFSPMGSDISIQAVMLDGALHLSIADQGVGMSAEQIEQLFSFSRQTTLGTQGEKGAGIGLILTYDLVQRQGAHIQVSSTPGQGTTFTLIFPQLSPLPAASSIDL